MYIDTIGTTYEKASLSTTATNDLGREDFLTLLVAQLKHQDPLNPLESTEFTSQLAQYSSLEQLFNVNKNLEVISSGQKEASKLQSLDFIGKEIVAEGENLLLEQGRTSMGSFNLDVVADCSVLITDANGDYVRKMSLGYLEPGSHEFEWDGRDDSGNIKDAGIYNFGVMAVDEDGQILSVDKRITGKVTGVDFDGGSPILYMGKIPISLSQVVDIRFPESD
jgi:flagellar basal-body rod modification protein FlgD